ncbi:MAG: plasmid pRiA4b ORF-3 family protein [Chloroflexota bacterium]|nr:plasmid pRiA4b ORF-3 family protein [Chloroflexota bacterium]
MPTSAKDIVREVLRASGPLSPDEIANHPTAVEGVTTRNPRQTIRNALTNDFLVQSTGDGRYVYLPTFAKGARMRIPMRDAASGEGLLRVGAEVIVLLWLNLEYFWKAPATSLRLEDGPTVAVEQDHMYARDQGFLSVLAGVLRLPPEFWRWWQTREQAGGDTLVLRCEDGEAGWYSATTIRSEAQNVEVITASNARARKTAEEVLRRTDGMGTHELARRLLARGVYHAEPPDPLTRVLFEPRGEFTIEGAHRITFRPELTPALRELFADRLLEEEQSELGGAIRRLMGMPLAAQQQPKRRRSSRQRRATRLFRIKVSLAWQKRVWRVIEILDNQTLEDLHDAIQDAFGWDDDHLYSFYMSNRAWDNLTVIARPTEFEYDPPTADEVTPAQLDLQQGQKFLYIFDFGDDLRHNIEVMHIVTPPPPGEFPRIVLRQGKAPVQYPGWEDEDED